MKVKKTKLALYGEIKDILEDNWDPIGVKDVSQASGEYSAYVGSICDLLQGGADENKIYEELELIAADNMGIPRSKELVEATENATQKIMNIIL